ncbi:ImmA/IrrE family metallo-endopeptidase [uncultured Sphingomonas sp.]|uniref:ImmA/IrrE family metallo-endopeptidase n=1 Tax=uncultured Sphingomonas sp. TaxID=158754 RepID=UPI002596CEC1|nr:ImmA/IrrE family metallo-endopeptidase [uncultured Sphingomonas sp.]
MKLLGVRTPPRLLVDQPVTLELVNDGSSTAEAVAGSSVLVSPRVIKGFLSGSARKIASDNTPLSSMLRAYVGWGVDGHSEDGREWLKRYSQFLDVIERVDPYTASVEQQQAFSRRMSARVDAANAPADFASVYHDVAIEGRPPSVDQELAMSEFLFMAQTMVLDPALKFLLAHEVGHVALGHTGLAAADCRQRQRIERDADAFAIALLSYEPMGIVEAIQYQAAAPRQSTRDFVEEAMSTEAQLERFGFVQALGYGMAEAGLGEGQGCALTTSAERAENVRSSLRSVMTARLDAIRPFVLYMNQHPNVGAMRDTDRELAGDDIRDLLRDGVAGCKGAPAKQEVQRQSEPWMPYRFRYMVRCIVPPPPVGTITPRDRQLAGWLWRSSFDSSYKLGS